LPSTDAPIVPLQPGSSIVYKPISFDIPDDDDYLPLNLLPPVPPLLNHIPDPQPNPEPQPNPDTSLPRRSSRIASSQNNSATGIPKQTALEHAVQESKASTERRAAEKEERRRHADETQMHVTGEPPTHTQPEITTVAELSDALEKLKIYDAHHTNLADAVLSALGNTNGIDSRNMGFDDEPRTWKEAQTLSEAKEWMKGYLDELKSLKVMGVYKLVPRSSVPAGAKI
jgi:hypothetical protein